MDAYPISVGEPLAEPPTAHFDFLETLWFQISGTLCNLRCNHCFISCSPDNHTLEMMETREVFRYLDQAKELGVKEIYYTGGEPFIHKDILDILERTLRDFPTSVLTNGLPINDQRADRLKRLSEGSRYSLEIRISLDDHDEKRNDAVRGKGTFRQVLNTYKRLYERDFLPILTVSEIRDYLHPGAGHRERGTPIPIRNMSICWNQSVWSDPASRSFPFLKWGCSPFQTRLQASAPK